jgi:hypothetical protein
MLFCQKRFEEVCLARRALIFGTIFPATDLAYIVRKFAAGDAGSLVIPPINIEGFAPAIV